MKECTFKPNIRNFDKAKEKLYKSPDDLAGRANNFFARNAKIDKKLTYL